VFIEPDNAAVSLPALLALIIIGLTSAIWLYVYRLQRGLS
jgi:hypothetical protein